MKKVIFALIFASLTLAVSLFFGLSGAHSARASGEIKSANATAGSIVNPLNLSNSLGASSYLSNITPSPQLLPESRSGAAPEGAALLQPLNGSNIRAILNVDRVAGTNTIIGFATGMDPNKAYVSLFYDAGSPGIGPCACIPSNPPPAALAATCRATNSPPVNFSQMVIGYWLPLVGSSRRTLRVLKAGDPSAPAPLASVPLENIGSISVREDTQLGAPLPAAPDPARFQLRACGAFNVNGANLQPAPTPAPTPAPISPVVECITDNGDGSFTARFGYNNPNPTTITIPVGENNKFVPTKVGLSQPTTFLPGRQRNVLRVISGGGNLVWVLNGRTATASFNHPTRCPQ